MYGFGRRAYHLNVNTQQSCKTVSENWCGGGGCGRSEAAARPVAGNAVVLRSVFFFAINLYVLVARDRCRNLTRRKSIQKYANVRLDSATASSSSLGRPPSPVLSSLLDCSMVCACIVVACSGVNKITLCTFDLRLHH